MKLGEGLTTADQPILHVYSDLHGELSVVRISVQEIDGIEDLAEDSNHLHSVVTMLLDERLADQSDETTVSVYLTDREDDVRGQWDAFLERNPAVVRVIGCGGDEEE
jgi:hypothetical protein